MKKKGVINKATNNVTARESAIAYANHIRQFLQVMSDNHSQSLFPNALLRFEEMLARIEKSSPPLRTKQELNRYILPSINAIIQFSEKIGRQLWDFWMAHKKIREQVTRKGHTYDPFEEVQKFQEKFDDIHAKSNRVLGRFLENASDEINVYALLFIHILKTETVENKLIHQLNLLLDRYGLSSEFNATRIYSVGEPIKKKTGDKKLTLLTQAEAIRNCLAHDLFEISFESGKWKIVFDNKGEYGIGRFGYSYKTSFTKDEFQEYFALTQTLYSSTIVLIYLAHLYSVAAMHLLEQTIDGSSSAHN